jgi:hypothetical protein
MIIRFSLWGLFVLVTVCSLYRFLFRVAGIAAMFAALFIATIGAWLDHRAHRTRSKDQEREKQDQPRSRGSKPADTENHLNT